jgi:hypothetical protein
VLYFDWLHAWGCLGEPEGRKHSADKRIGLKPIRKQTFKKASLRSALKGFAVKHTGELIYAAAFIFALFMCGVFLIVDLL